MHSSLKMKTNKIKIKLQRASQNKIIKSIDDGDKFTDKGFCWCCTVLGDMLIAWRRLMWSKYVPAQEAMKMQKSKKAVWKQTILQYNAGIVTDVPHTVTSVLLFGIFVSGSELQPTVAMKIWDIGNIPTQNDFFMLSFYFLRLNTRQHDPSTNKDKDHWDFVISINGWHTAST